MAISDYIPQLFAAQPIMYEGLLSPQDQQGLSQRSNVAGLLGAAVALAQGMGSQGQRRSAAQNILSSLAAGYGASGQAYQTGIEQMLNAQKMAMQQRQMAGVQAMKMKYPDLADELDANPAGAFRLISEIEAAKRKPTTVGEGQALVSPTGEVLYKSPGALKKNTAVVGGALINLDTGEPIYQAPKERRTQIVNGQIVDVDTGQVIYGSPTKQAPEIKDFADGTTRQFDPVSGSWKIVARKPAGEGKTMYEGKPTLDASGKLVFLPTRPGLPVVDAATGKPVDYAAKQEVKPLPSTLQKAEEEDYDNGQAAANLANDANNYLKSISSGQIKFGVINRATMGVQRALGSSDPDVIAREDFERFRTTLINESLRLNKGTQTEGDAVRAAKELDSAESPEAAAKAMQTLRDLNARRAKDYGASIDRRRTNAKVSPAEVKLDVPKFEPYVFTKADYAKLPKGATYIDMLSPTKGQRKVKK